MQNVHQLAEKASLRIGLYSVRAIVWNSVQRHVSETTAYLFFTLFLGTRHESIIKGVERIIGSKLPKFYKTHQFRESLGIVI